jgi:glycosyltransferase involved in cell wall biosynthesis
VPRMPRMPMLSFAGMTHDSSEATGKIQNARPREQSLRVGLFQAGWPLQSHTLNLAKGMMQEGYAVDLYLFDVGTSFVDLESAASEGLSVHVWGSSSRLQYPDGQATFSRSALLSPVERTWIPSRLRPPARVLKRLSKRMLAQVANIGRETGQRALLHSRPCWNLLPRRVLLASAQQVTAKPPAVLVGIEQLGLIWAAEVARLTGAAYAYYSLELYTRDSPRSQTPLARRIKLCEARCHRAAAATIIQDEARARVLLTDNGVQATSVLYLPVSVRGPARRSRTTFLHDRLGLAHDVQIVLQTGNIGEGRLSLPLAIAAQSLPSGCRLVMHGRGSPPDLQAIAAADREDRISLSTELVGESEFPDLVASAAVGLVLYSPRFDNDRLTSRSSEKLALLLRAGVPVVAFAYPGYEVIRDYACGVLIDRLDELPSAVGTILADRDTYSDNAVRCFEEQYDYSRLVPPVVAALGRLVAPVLDPGPANAIRSRPQ